MVDNITTSSSTTVPSGDDLVVEALGPAVLLVDDQPARLMTYEAILGDLRLQLVRCLSGEDALRQLLKREFAAIVLDVNMPGMDGFETARYIREHHRLKQTPIIFVTGVNVTELDQLKGYEVGAIDYIPVPVVPAILRSKISLLVELYNRRAELARLNFELDKARARLEAERDEAFAARDSIQQIALDHSRTTFEHPSEIAVVLSAVRSEVGTITDWRYSDANSNALRTFNRSRDELVGRLLSDVLPDQAERLSGLYEQVLQDRAPTGYQVSANEINFDVRLFPLGLNCVVSAAIEAASTTQAQPIARSEEHETHQDSAWLTALLNTTTDEVISPAGMVVTPMSVPQ